LFLQFEDRYPQKGRESRLLRIGYRPTLLAQIATRQLNVDTGSKLSSHLQRRPFFATSPLVDCEAHARASAGGETSSNLNNWLRGQLWGQLANGNWPASSGHNTLRSQCEGHPPANEQMKTRTATGFAGFSFLATHGCTHGVGGAGYGGRQSVAKRLNQLCPFFPPASADQFVGGRSTSPTT